MEKKIMRTKCCGILEQLADDYDFPFFEPLVISEKTKDIEVRGWAIKLLRKTPSGGISKKGATVFLNFCPFCGTEILLGTVASQEVPNE